MQGRLVGKRVAGSDFVEEFAAHGAECCNYLLAVDVDMNTVAGYAMSSWDTGYGDMVMTPDLSTLRLLPWLPGTALVITDLVLHDGSAVAAAPRSILRRQLDRLGRAGAGRQRRHRTRVHGVRRHLPAGVGRRLPRADCGQRLQHRLRHLGVVADGAAAARHPAADAGAGLHCEAIKGECNRGQQELGFRYDDALVTCDNHTIYKNGAKEIADQHGKSLTFMAKYDEREGNSCHIHLSLRARGWLSGVRR